MRLNGYAFIIDFKTLCYLPRTFGNKESVHFRWGRYALIQRRLRRFLCCLVSEARG